VPALPAGEQLPAAMGDGTKARGRLFTAIVLLLDELGAHRTMVLVFDDLHAADRATLQLAEHLIRSLPDRRWLLLGTYRREEAISGSPLSRLVSWATREGLGRQAGLFPLSQADSERLCAALLRATVDRAVMDELHALSLGNPLFLQELIQARQESGALLYRTGQWVRGEVTAGRVPTGIQDLVDTRVLAMGLDVRRSLDTRAVLGMQSEYELIQVVTGAQEERLLSALDDAVEAHILDEHDECYSFRHPLFREALYHRLSPCRRRQIHLRVAQVLTRERPDDVEALLYHHRAAGHQEETVTYLGRAGDRAQSLFAHDVAEGHYRELVKALDRLGGGEDAAQARVTLSTELSALARYDEAVEMLEEAISGFERDAHVEQVLTATAELGRVHVARGSLAPGLERIQQVVRRYGDRSPTAGLAALLIVQAYLTFRLDTHWPEAVQTAETAVQVARCVDNQDLQIEAEMRLFTALAASDRNNECDRLLEHLLPHAEQHSYPQILASSLNSAAGFCATRGEFERAARYLEQTVQITARINLWDQNAFQRAYLGNVLFYQGRWEEARRHLEAAMEAGRELGEGYYAQYRLLYLGELELASGNDSRGRSLLMRCLDLSYRLDDVMTPILARRVLALHGLLDGELEKAMEWLAPYSSAPRSQEGVLLAWAEIERGECDRAHHLLDRITPKIETAQARLVGVHLLRVRAMEEARRGDVAGADRVFTAVRAWAAVLDRASVQFQPLTAA